MTQRLAILGPGTLGRDLALYAASRGWDVDLAGRSQGHAEAALERLSAKAHQLQRPPLLEALTRIRAVHGPAPFEAADVLFEALPEDLPLKQGAWRTLEAAARPDALLLTGTSCLSPREVGGLMEDPERLTAFHLFVPLHHSRVVELATSSHQEPAVIALAAAWGLEALAVSGQGGLAASRMGLSMGLEAMRLLEEGAASAEVLDRLMVKGYGLPVGPLELSDRVGLDVRLAIAQHLHRSTGDSRWVPPAILTTAVAEGRLGRKTGRGFFPWPLEGDRA